MQVSAFFSTAKLGWRWALCGLFLLGCSPDAVVGEANPQPPQGVLSRDSFIHVMAEIQVIEGASHERLYRNDNERQRLAQAYHDVWQRTGVSPDQFEQSHAWWWKQPLAMKSILGDVIEQIKTMEVEANQQDTTVSSGAIRRRFPSGKQAPSSQ